MFLGKIRPTVKNSIGNKTSSSNLRSVINSSYILELFEYLILSYLEIYLISRAYRPSTGCLSIVKTLLKETLFHCNLMQCGVFSPWLISHWHMAELIYIPNAMKWEELKYLNKLPKWLEIHSVTLYIVDSQVIFDL